MLEAWGCDSATAYGLQAALGVEDHLRSTRSGSQGILVDAL